MVMITKDELRPEYDYIVVGGGTAGCVLANRLSERRSRRPGFNVLVVEAGEYRPQDAKINTPGRMPELTGNSEYDWMFATVPQRHCNNRVINHARGRVLGGSSALQYGMCVFPSQSSINAWESLGNPSWGWNDMAKYYRKFHTVQMPSQEVAEQLQIDWIDRQTAGSIGPLKVSFPGSDFVTPLHEAWPRTFKNLGYAKSDDPMTGLVTGAYCNPATVEAGTKTRSYAASAFYKPVAGRENLHVLTKTQVERVTLTQGSNGEVTATGIEWSIGEDKHVVSAAREVVICAGAFQSPQLLELSGIGQVERLESLGIECFVDLVGVGENLQDHVFCRIAFELKEGATSSQPLHELIEQYEESKTGVLSSMVVCNAYMPLPEYMPPPYGKPADRMRLAEAIAANIKTSDPALYASQTQQFAILRRILEDEKDTTAQYRLVPFRVNAHMAGSADGPSPNSAQDTADYVTISTTLSHPFSRGSVHVESRDVRAKPLLDPAYLSNALDAELLARHVAFSAVVARTAPLADLIKPGGRTVPAEAAHLVSGSSEAGDLGSKSAWLDLVRAQCVSTYHPSSSCAMMPRRLGGVVDSRLKVHGCKRLRVCDASVFPLVPRGNIQSSVYAVAEKAADMIWEEALQAGNGPVVDARTSIHVACSAKL